MAPTTSRSRAAPVTAAPDQAPIRVLLVDDHALFRSGVRALLQRHAALEIVGEAGDGRDGVAAALALQPHVVLLDLHMPGLSGLDTLAAMRQACPQAAILMLTLSEEAGDLGQAMLAGACGYLIKTIDADYLLHAIRRAAAGEVVVAEAMTGKLVAQWQGGADAPPGHADLERLTARETEVLAFLARGHSNKVIARSLSLAEGTVKIHVQNVLRKLKLTSRVQAAVFAVEQRMQPGAPLKSPP
jgi:two-component system nitrate/nitrite response regulator NarL